MTVEGDRTWPFRIIVGGDGPVELGLEPWGEFYSVTKSSVIEVTVYGPLGARPPEIVHGLDRIDVWAAAGCTASLLIDGKDPHPAGVERPRVPNVPGLGGTG